MAEANETPKKPLRATQGVVVSDAMDKSVVVRVDRTKLHPRYKKVLKASTKVHVHDERNDAHVGDTVSFVRCRPLSKTKSARLVEIVERAR